MYDVRFGFVLDARRPEMMRGGRGRLFEIDFRRANNKEERTSAGD